MSENDADMPDVFGKIDALLGKRVGFAPVPKMKSLEEEFPLLTDVVARDVESDLPAPTLDAVLSAGTQPMVQTDSRAAIRAELEALLTDMFIRQQVRLEESVRKAVREELLAQGRGGK